MSDPLLYEQEDHVVVLTLNSHETRNVISGDEMVEAIVDACNRINADRSVRVAIITGAGSAFSSGGNIKDMHDKKGMFGGSPPDLRDGYRNGIQRIPKAVYDLEVPIIAAVNGAAIGAGCDLAMMCDMRIASERGHICRELCQGGVDTWRWRCMVPATGGG